jgi:hypothetical protein
MKFFVSLSYAVLLTIFCVVEASADVICITTSKALVIRKSCKSGEKQATVSNIVGNNTPKVGPAGPAGPQGPQGIRGFTGATGSPGVSSRTLEKSSNTVTIVAGGTYGSFVTCSGSKKPLGGGCQSSNSKVVTYYGFPDETQSFYSFFCGFRNITNSPVSVTVTAHAVCAVTK